MTETASVITIDSRYVKKREKKKKKHRKELRFVENSKPTKHIDISELAFLLLTKCKQVLKLLGLNRLHI
jgi:hypothetical protein